MTQVCAQRHKVATEGILFPSKSSDKVYKVTAFRPGEFPFCSCPSYIFSRSKEAKKEGVHQNTIPGTCKHLESVLASACDWRQETEEQYQFNGICPKCAGPLVEEGTYEIPDDPAHAVDDLRAMLAEINGEDAPAPLPKPQPYTIEFTMTTKHTVEVEALDASAALTTFSESPGDYVDQATEVDAYTVDNVKVRGATTDLPKPKKPRKAAAKKAAPARSRQVDVTGLVQGAKR
jgi:hypothetical protein